MALSFATFVLYNYHHLVHFHENYYYEPVKHIYMIHNVLAVSLKDVSQTHQKERKFCSYTHMI